MYDESLIIIGSVNPFIKFKFLMVNQEDSFISIYRLFKSIPGFEAPLSITAYSDGNSE